MGRGGRVRVLPTASPQPHQLSSDVVDTSPPLSPVPEDLSLEEREELLDIRRRKKELIDDIEVKQQQSVQFEFVWNTK